MLKLTSIQFVLYPLLVSANHESQTTFSKNIENNWKQNMRKEITSQTLSQCSIFCMRDHDKVILEVSFFHKKKYNNNKNVIFQCDIFAMDEISKKCYYGKMLETLDPLSISAIDSTPFEVYSKIPGEKNVHDINSNLILYNYFF